ncbi:class I SAM-dependent methyltransferase [Pseudonocardia sp. DLS-67]
MTTTVKRRLIGKLVGQFHHPRGITGGVVGRVMAHRRSNVERNRRVVSLLDVQPAERVLEIGFGPGIAVAARVTRGQVYGIDHSEVMVRQAGRRNAAAVREGRVHLTHAGVDRRATTAQAVADLRDLLVRAGYTDLRVETLDLDPPVGCVVALKGG